MRSHTRLGLALCCLSATVGAQRPIEWTVVDRAMGKAGQMQPGDVYKYGFPRSDLSVTVDGVTLKPALALGGWVAFKAADDHDAMAMGDLVLRDDEVGPVMLKLREGGIEQTALHNHLLRETPAIVYMHIRAHGDPARVAAAIHAALALTSTPFATPAAPGASSASPLDTAAIGAALGHAGKLNGIVYQVGVARTEAIRDGGMVVPPAMGVATGINFQPTTDGKAVATGDFVLLGTEIGPVIQALSQHGIAVTALHSHMVSEEPRLFFMHFWGNDDAVALARGLRAALDQVR